MDNFLPFFFFFGVDYKGISRGNKTIFANSQRYDFLFMNNLYIIFKSFILNITIL